MLIINSTLINRSDDLYYYPDNFPLTYEDNDLNFDLSNRTYYDDYILNNNQTYSNDLSIFSFSSPFSYIILILILYLILTVILLSFSLYQQRQSEIENFYFGDTEEDIEQAKHCAGWKQLLIDKITKGDMEPLLIDTHSNSDGLEDSQTKPSTFPLHIV